MGGRGDGGRNVSQKDEVVEETWKVSRDVVAKTVAVNTTEDQHRS